MLLRYSYKIQSAGEWDSNPACIRVQIEWRKNVRPRWFEPCMY